MPEVHLRAACASDAGAIRRIYAPSITESSVSFELEVPTDQEMARRIESVSRHVPWLVAERKGEVAGYAYAGPFRARAAYQWTRESSVYIAPAHHRTGVARALMEALIGICRELGYRTLVAGATMPNPGSGGLHESLGFQPVGEFPNVGRKRGEWHRVGFWALDLWQEDSGAAPDVEPPRRALAEGTLRRILNAAASR